MVFAVFGEIIKTYQNCTQSFLRFFSPKPEVADFYFLKVLTESNLFLVTHSMGVCAVNHHLRGLANTVN